MAFDSSDPTFQDLDEAEQRIGKSVLFMTDNELVTYIKTSLKVLCDMDLPVTANRERSIMAGFQKVYGPDAGRVIKWVFWRWGGKVNDQYVTYGNFSKAMKWRTDMWYLELQQHIKSHVKGVAAPGFSRLEDL